MPRRVTSAGIGKKWTTDTKSSLVFLGMVAQTEITWPSCAVMGHKCDKNFTIGFISREFLDRYH